VCLFITFLQFETTFHVNALFVIHDLRHILNTPSLNRSSQPTACTKLVETCHTLLLRFDAPIPVLNIRAFPLDRTRQQHSL